MSSRVKEIYLIRHGETAYNRLGVVQGSGIDAELNDLGKAQAQAFYEAYQHLPFQKIYISELQRTFQSVQAFIEAGIPFEKHAGLNEISWGIKEGKKPDPSHDSEHTNMIKGWRMGHTYLASPGGESPQQVAERQKVTVQHILSRTDEDLILIAMHGRAMRILLTQLLQKPLADMDDFQHSNLCLYHLQYHYDSQSFAVLRENDTEHLVHLTV
ncbi:MAG: histidine phosphatase family protein [Spirosomataceae bacterium]